MKEIRYSALTSSGQTVTGVRMAANSDELANDLLEQGLVLLGTKPSFGSFTALLTGGAKAGRKELRDFTQHMSTCLGAGITAMAALGDFQTTAQGTFADVLSDIRGDVSSGSQLDESFARHPNIFSPVYLAMVTAGQRSGSLDQAFEELVAYLEWQEDLRSQTTQAMIYPSMLMGGIIGLFLLMMLFVVPRFETMFEGADFELPTITVKMMAAGHFMGHWWWAIFSVIGAVVISSKIFFKTERGAYARDKILLSIPVLGSFQKKLALSRFSKTFSLIFASGVDLLLLLKLMQNVVDNKVMAAQLAVVRARVATGETLTESFRDADVFPPLIQRLVAVGEATGSLDVSVRKASDYLDKEIPRELKRTFTIFEGMVLVFLGAMVAVAGLSLLMPIMSIRSALH